MISAGKRRDLIIEKLTRATTPVSAAALASQFGVSRQIIVGDIALIRASGVEISATPRGYVLNKPEENPGTDTCIRRIACNHSAAQMEEELLLCIDYGCELLDVIVEHPVYGQLTGALTLKSRYDVRQFIEKVAAADAHALSELTDGIHLHTLRCPSPEIFEKLCLELKERGILVS